jgi:hypothetical protein
LSSKTLLTLTSVLTVLLLACPVLAASPVDTTSATRAAAAELAERWQFQFYRVTEPTQVFFASIPESLVSGLWIKGPPPKGLLPTLGTIDRCEFEPGHVEENTGIIFLYMKGNLTEASKGEKNGFSVLTYDPPVFYPPTCVPFSRSRKYMSAG